MNNRLIFEVQRGSVGGEVEWLVNGKAFDPHESARSKMNPAGLSPLAQQKMGSFNPWSSATEAEAGCTRCTCTWRSTGPSCATAGTSRRSVRGTPTTGRGEDLVALDPGESVIIYRGFRDFVGPYVGHCHNLAHEDHAMMFGWEIT